MECKSSLGDDGVINDEFGFVSIVSSQESTVIWYASVGSLNLQVHR